MKNKKVFLILLVLFCIFILIMIFNSNIYINEIITFFLNLGDTNYFFLYLSLSTLYFLTPLPITIIILFNGYFFDNIGFFYSILMTLFGSSVLYFLSFKIKYYFNINFDEIFKKKKINIIKISKNNYSIFFSRLVIPYFLHNIYYGVQGIKFSKFILYAILAEIPMIFALNTVGSSMKFFSHNNSLSFIELISNKNFYIPFFIILLILFLLNYVNSKFIKQK